MRVSDIAAWKVGTKVIVGGKIPAIITGMLIRDDDYITYECVWFDNAVRHSAWLDRLEFTPQEKSETIRIGFSSNGTNARNNIDNA